MYRYAQTNIQLFNQIRQDYSAEDLSVVHKAYQLAMQLFTGRFRPSGKTLLDHLVGTASILASLHAPAPLVAAGLLHAAYDHADFGTDEKGISEFKRTYVRESVGPDVEDYITRYTECPWNSKSMRVMLDGIENLNTIDRDVLLMRLANQLEDYLDYGILYCPNADKRRKSFERRQVFITAMAKKLGFPALAEELEKIGEGIRKTQISAELRNIATQQRAYFIEPLSYRKKL